MNRYNEFIKTIEPNLSKILFSKKVVLVEGPNDVLVYKHAIQRRVLEVIEHDTSVLSKQVYADGFLNFENISIICHHGKATALYLIEVCKHFNLEFFIITDWDLVDFIVTPNYLDGFDSENRYKGNIAYKSSDSKGIMTTNYHLIKAAGLERIHFNDLRLESVIGYEHDDKSSFKIWKLISRTDFAITEQLFPYTLGEFLGIMGLQQIETNMSFAASTVNAPDPLEAAAM
jgi:hypothetical protein